MYAKHLGAVIGPPFFDIRRLVHETSSLALLLSLQPPLDTKTCRSEDLRPLGTVPHWLHGVPWESEHKAFRKLDAGPYNSIPSDLLRADNIFGLGVHFDGIATTSLAARYRDARTSSVLETGFRMIQDARVSRFASLFASCTKL